MMIVPELTFRMQSLLQEGFRKIRSGLAFRISLMASVLALGFMLAVGATSYYLMRAQIIANIDMGLEHEVALQAGHLSDEFNSVTSRLSALARHSLVLKVLTDSLTRQAFLVPLLDSLKEINGVTLKVALTDFEGQVLAVNAPLQPDLNEWRRQVLQEGKPFAAVTLEDHGEFLLMVEPIFSSTSSPPAGALLGKIPLAGLSERTIREQRWKYSVQLVHALPARAVLRPPEAAAKDLIARTQTLAVNGILGALGLGVEVRAERNLLYSPLERLFRNYVYIGILAMLAVLASSIVAGRYLTRPLRRLERVASAVIASGSFNHRFPSAGIDEIARLGEAFNQMLERLRGSYQQLARESGKRLAELAERARAEQALRRSEERFRTIFDAVNDAIFIHDLSSGDILEVNRRMCTMYGYSPEELQGIKVETLSSGTAPYTQRDALEWMRRAGAGEPQLFEWQAKDKRGRLFWVEVNMKLAVIDGEKRLLVVVRDISERRQAEERHRDLANILESSLNEIYIFDADTLRFLEVNRGARQNLGYSIDELRELTPLDLEPHSTPGSFADLVEPLRAGKVDKIRLTAEHRRKDGSVYPVDVHLQLSTFESRSVFVAIVLDISDRRLAEQALFEEKERALVTLHSLGEGVITTDAAGMVQYLNAAAESLTGWPLAEARSLPLGRVLQIIADESGEKWPLLLASLVREQRISGSATLHSRCSGEYAIEYSAALIRGRRGEVMGLVVVFRDVSEARRLTRQIAYEATHDALTGLVNRREFEKRLDHALASAKQYGSQHALCYLDLDQFKIINDTAGHAAGDELLKQIKELLLGVFRERDTLARLGGDEFGLLLDNCPVEKASEIADSLVASIRDYRFAWAGRNFQIGVSIGLVPLTAASEDTAKLLSQADVACYIAKERGRNRVHVYQADDSESAQRHSEILRAAGLRDALEEGSFCLYRQPILPLAAGEGRRVRYEVLLRLRDDDGEIIFPGAFIPAAERYGLMAVIDRWVIRTAFRRYAEYLNASGVEMAINLSGNSLSDEAFLKYVKAQFSYFALKPEQVCFEITETAAIYNLSQAREFMAEIKRCGSRLALDDFGSGLSSFSYLKTLPVDYLKIDGSFVRNMVDDPIDCAMVEAINEVGHIMGIETVAEYAHSQGIVERLRALGVDYAQGYALGLPVPWSGDTEAVTVTKDQDLSFAGD